MATNIWDPVSLHQSSLRKAEQEQAAVIERRAAQRQYEAAMRAQTGEEGQTNRGYYKTEIPFNMVLENVMRWNAIVDRKYEENDPFYTKWFRKIPMNDQKFLDYLAENVRVKPLIQANGQGRIEFDIDVLVQHRQMNENSQAGQFSVKDLSSDAFHEVCGPKSVDNCYILGKKLLDRNIDRQNMMERNTEKYIHYFRALSTFGMKDIVRIDESTGKVESIDMAVSKRCIDLNERQKLANPAMKKMSGTHAARVKAELHGGQAAVAAFDAGRHTRIDKRRADEYKRLAKQNASGGWSCSDDDGEALYEGYQQLNFNKKNPPGSTCSWGTYDDMARFSNTFALVVRLAVTDAQFRDLGFFFIRHPTTNRFEFYSEKEYLQKYTYTNAQAVGQREWWNQLARIFNRETGEMNRALSPADKTVTVRYMSKDGTREKTYTYTFGRETHPIGISRADVVYYDLPGGKTKENVGIWSKKKEFQQLGTPGRLGTPKGEEYY